MLPIIRHAVLLIALVACLPHTARSQPTASSAENARRIDALVDQLYPATEAAPARSAAQPTTATQSGTGTPRLVVRRPARRTTTTTTTRTTMFEEITTATHPAAPAIDLDAIGTTTLTATSATTVTHRPVVLPEHIQADSTPVARPAGPAVLMPVPAATATAGSATSSSAVEVIRPAGPLRVNSASEQELIQHLNLDARRARMIIEFRQVYGPFHGPDDLEQVSGLNEDMIRRWENDDLLSFE